MIISRNFIKINILYLFVFVALFLFSAVHAAGLEEAKNATQAHVEDTQSDGESPDDSYRLGVDDSIKVIVFGESDLSNTYSVGSGGSISFPLIGEVPVVGLTLKEVEKTLTAKLSDGYLVNPSVSIEVASYRAFYILGEVRAPGSYSYANGITVLKAVATAGGFTYRANKKHVQVLKTRKNGSDLYEKVPVSTSIAPGDIILVKERFF